MCQIADRPTPTTEYNRYAKIDHAQAIRVCVAMTTDEHGNNQARTEVYLIRPGTPKVLLATSSAAVTPRQMQCPSFAIHCKMTAELMAQAYRALATTTNK